MLMVLRVHRVHRVVGCLGSVLVAAARSPTTVATIALELVPQAFLLPIDRDKEIIFNNLNQTYNTSRCHPQLTARRRPRRQRTVSF